MMTMKNKCSFDWDDTLRNVTSAQRFVSELIEKDWDVWVVTSRYDTEGALLNGWHWIEKENNELFELTDKIGINRENIVFTNHGDKIDYLHGKGFLFHVDDSPDELIKIMDSDDGCYPICVDYFAWEETLREKFNI